MTKISKHVIKQDGIIDSNLAENSVGSSELKSDAVNGAVHIQDESIPAAAFILGSITSAILADNAVTQNKIADGAVTDDAIGDEAVTQSKLAKSSVGTPELFDNAVTTDKIGDNAVTQDKIADDAILQRHLTDGLIGDDNINDGAISLHKLGPNDSNGDPLPEGSIAYFNSTSWVTVTPPSFSESSDSESNSEYYLRFPEAGAPVWDNRVIPTGVIYDYVGTEAVSGFVVCNGKTIGNTGSGATQRANGDTKALFRLLWGQGATVTPSKGSDWESDWNAGRQITLPDLRGRMTAGRDEMDNSASSRITSGLTTGPTNATLSYGGVSSLTLTENDLPPHKHFVFQSTVLTNGTGSVPSPTQSVSYELRDNDSAAGHYKMRGVGSNPQPTVSPTSITGNNGQGTSIDHPNMPPFMLFTKIIKL